MTGSIRTLLQALKARRVALRRGRNLRAAARRALTPARIPAEPRRRRFLPPLPGLPRLPVPGPALWITLAGLAAALAGGVVIARHAHTLALAVDLPDDSPGRDTARPLRRLPQFQAIAPGAALQVPAGASLAVVRRGDASLVVQGAGMRAAPPLRIDLCGQMRDQNANSKAGGGALVPLRIGYGFDDVARWAGDGAAPGLRAVALAGPDSAGMPKIQIAGDALGAGAALTLRWDQAPAGTRWIGDSNSAGAGARGQVAFAGDGWLVWADDAAIRFQRQAGGRCGAGQLTMQMMRAHGAGPVTAGARGLIAAYPATGKPVAAWLAAGDYQVPAAAVATPGLEDQALFEQLRARGMLRLDAQGMAELAPRDLPAWRAAPAVARAAGLASWDQVVLDDGAVKLFKHLYRMADGAYVREQVRIFNGERRLLAWRVALGTPAAATWQASVGNARAAVTPAMPASAARLFAAVGHGWQPWNRIDGWPLKTDGAGAARLTLAVTPALAARSIKLMLIGRAGAVEGAVVRQRQPVCDGRACPGVDAAQVLVLDVAPGARTVSIEVAPLDMAVLALPGDQQYRHLQVAGGQLGWRALPFAALHAGAAVPPPPPAAVTLEDRNGAPLWAAGAPTAAATAAGLAPLLGMRDDHAASVAGMLSRLPAGAAGHHARLTLDLALQGASQRAVDCIGMRHGHPDGGGGCGGGQAAPAGRHAGMVILDAETGDILAAAGAGGTPVTAANWLEVRNFDRSDPARSPLRLPAWQHDGGAHASPGSTFKVISALGLEQAARTDPYIDAMLGGLPLAHINGVARRRGFAFQTDAAIYPMNERAAHITNYKGQSLDRRAVDGRLGLAQALTYSLNTWFAWTGELSDRSLFGRADGGVPDVQALTPGALDAVRPIVAAARRLGFGEAMRLDGGLLPADFAWGAWDALQSSASNIDPVHSRHELRQMAIGLRMQVTPLQMALAAGAVGQGVIIAPRLLLNLDGRSAAPAASKAVGVRLDRIRAGMKGVVDAGTAAGAFGDPRLARVRRGLSGKTGTAPTGSGEQATVWFTGYLEPGSLPGQTHRLALAAFVSHSAGSGGEHAAPIVAAVLADAAGVPLPPAGKNMK